MKLNQRIQIREGTTDHTIIATCWASVELTSISLYNDAIGPGNVNKYSYLIHIRKHSPYGRMLEPYNQILYSGKLYNIDTVSETRDGLYLRLLCTETNR